MHADAARRLLAILLASMAARLPGQDPEANAQGRTHFLGREIAQTMHWTGAPWLLRATREDEENGALLRQWLAVQPGQRVCDLGCGNGYHTLPLAETVGPTGVVYAVDVQPEMLALLQKRADAKDLAHLVCRTATVDDPQLPQASCDLVLLVDVYHELSHPVRVMAHVRAALRPGGRVVLVEFRDEDRDVPIKPEHKMGKAQIVREMAAHGFAFAHEFDGLPWQHAMAFTPADRDDARLAPREFVHGFVRASASELPATALPFLAAEGANAPLPKWPPGTSVTLQAGPNATLLATLRAPAGATLPGARRELVLACRDDRWQVTELREPTPFVRAHGARRPLALMHTALGGGSWPERAQLARELGSDGVECPLAEAAEARRAAEALHLDLHAAYAVFDLTQSWSAEEVRTRLQPLVGSPAMLWLALSHGPSRPSAATGDEPADAAPFLRAIAEVAGSLGLRVALYPHHGFWLATHSHARQLCERVDHPALGLCFNPCHFLRAREGDPIAALKPLRARLFAVTVHGAELDGDSWSTLIQPLGNGNFDLRGFLQALDGLGFAGPVGLQGFGVPGPPRAHLTASLRAWRSAQD